jgi:hypothetical protein
VEQRRDERWLDERQQNGTTEFAGKSLRLSSGISPGGNAA